MSEPSQKMCMMHPCEELISARSKHDFCPNCRRRIEFWAKRSPSAFLARKVKLQVWANRMGYVREEKRDKYAPFRATITKIEAKPDKLPPLEDLMQRARERDRQQRARAANN